MTVNTETDRALFDGTGAQTVFPYTFPILQDADMRVVLIAADGTETVLVQDTNYTITGAGTDEGGAVTTIGGASPEIGEKLLLIRAIAYLQPTDFKNQGRFFPRTHERSFDRAAMQIQRLAGGLSRAVRFSDTLGGFDAELPAPTANYVAAVNDAGDGMTLVPPSTLASLGADFLQSGTGAQLRTVQSKLRESFSVRDFGATGDGVTDDTAAIQAAITAAAGRELFFPAGTYIVTSLTGASNTVFQGESRATTVIKRKAAAVGNTEMLGFTSASNFTLRGLTIDGNKASQTSAAINCVLAGCSNFTVEDCAFINAKAIGGFGEGLLVIDCDNGGFGRVSKCYLTGNDARGLLVTRSADLTIDGNFASGNGAGGIELANYVFPPVDNAQTRITVSNNQCNNNTGSGIGCRGYYTGGTISAPIYGPSAACSFITITGNVCNGNGVYGIAYQGSYGTVSGNVCDGNTGAGFSGGILFNCLASTCVGNVCRNNEAFGIDSGGTYHSTVVGNQCFANPTGINMGASVSCRCDANQITFTIAGTGISMPGIDGDGISPFPAIGKGTTISNNVIDMNGFSAGVGIYVLRSYRDAVVIGNTVNNAGAVNRAFVLETDYITVANNVDNYLAGITGQAVPQVTAAAPMVIPDHIETAVVAGNTNITSIRTYSMNVFDGKVRDVLMSNQGSGYVRATPPTVGFSGGGGSGAAATVEIDNGGRIIGVTMTNNGSGYTSAPSVSFTGGTGGAGAAATAVIGCQNANGRNLQFLFAGTPTINDTGNLTMAGSLVATANGATLRLLGSYGGFYETGRTSGM